MQVSPPGATVEVAYPEAGDWRGVPYKEAMRIPTGPVIVRAEATGYRSRALRLTMNVEEWVADCWHDNHRGARSDQQARSGRCSSHVLRGGAWDSPPDEATVSYRSFSNRGSGTRGFRVVREL